MRDLLKFFILIFLFSCEKQGTPIDIILVPDQIINDQELNDQELNDQELNDQELNDKELNDQDQRLPSIEDEIDPSLIELHQLVDPLIGSQGPGNVIVGALVPHGAVRVSPVSNISSSIDAYDYEDPEFIGLAHTHLEGPGGSANGYGQLVVTPKIGTPQALPQLNSHPLDHTLEKAEVGQYSIELQEQQISIKASSTGLSAIHQYHFESIEMMSEENQAYLSFNTALSRGKNLFSQIKLDPIIDQQKSLTLHGNAEYQAHPLIAGLLATTGQSTGKMKLYFHIEVYPIPERIGFYQGANAMIPDWTLSEIEGSQAGVILAWQEQSIDVTWRMGISLISEAQAKINLGEQTRDGLYLSFDQIVKKAQSLWNEILNRVVIEGEDDLKTKFYTALYHSAFQPANWSEGGKALINAGPSPVVLQTNGFHYLSDEWCLWDTYRTSWPLRMLIEPELAYSFVRSQMLLYQNGGWLQKCPWVASGDSRVMTGNPQLPMLVEAVIFGLTDEIWAMPLENEIIETAVNPTFIDIDELKRAMLKTADEDENPQPSGFCGYFGKGTVPEYIEKGYVSRECDSTQSASMTLEFAYADWTIAEFAKHIGEQDLFERFHQRSRNWKNHWDSELKFMRVKNADGSFFEPFDPTYLSDTSGFVEASSWIFSFFVPHQVNELIDLYGSKAFFNARLDEFFAQGYFDPSNQPSFHIPMLYNYSDQPWKTQALVHQLRQQNFSTQPNGLPGNDDAGSTSAWLVLTSLGLYPMAPGNGIFELFSPAIQSAKINLDPRFGTNTSLEILVNRSSPTAQYIQSVTLNDRPITEPRIHRDQLIAGGVLVFELGDEPSNWGIIE